MVIASAGATDVFHASWDSSVPFAYSLRVGKVVRMTSPAHKDIWYNRVKHFNLPGHVHFLTFSCYRRMPLLTHDLWCCLLAESISRSLEKHDMGLWAYVFMPDHVHLLVRPRREAYDISGFLRSTKNSAGKRILNSLREQQSPTLDDLQTKGVGADSLYRFWQAGPGYDKKHLELGESD